MMSNKTQGAANERTKPKTNERLDERPTDRTKNERNAPHGRGERTTRELCATGQKLKLGESIERALRRMRCPCELQAHQIQGLDYPAIFPVVQWLVKKVIATREELGERLRSFAAYYYEGPCKYDALAGGRVCTYVQQHGHLSCPRLTRMFRVPAPSVSVCTENFPSE